MAYWIRPLRVHDAIVALYRWRTEAKSQAAMHLWPLLALVEKGVNKNSFQPFREEDDREFWDRYGRLPGENRPKRSENDEFTPDYYIDPLVLQLKPSDYPHRSPSSIRVRTFLNSWHAAEFDESKQTWRLSSDYANIFGRKVLSRDDQLRRVPLVDLSVWLFREQEFPDGSSASTLLSRFQEVFKFEQHDFDLLFEFVDEASDRLFQTEKPTNEEYANQINTALLPRDPVTAIVRGEVAAETTQATSELPEDDSILLQVERLLALGTSGIIFRGCPGTSKTWYAIQIARRLVADPRHIFQIQFHPSFGYEDFVEGYRPDEEARSGFRIVDKIFLQACAFATSVSSQIVLIIDEINRGDPSRIFGELLTYIERGYRGFSFYRAYTGSVTAVPENIIIFGTMNQYDKSITQLDLALVRRFDHIDLRPSSETLTSFLDRSGGFTTEQIDRVVQWFESLQQILPRESGGIGHTYFKDARNPDDLVTIWQYRVKPYCESVLELEPQKLDHARSSFEAMYRAILAKSGGDTAS